MIRKAWFPGVLLQVAFSLAEVGRRDLWLDEAISLAATKHLASTAVHTGGTMILYYVLLTPWSWVSVSPFWLRLPSIIFMAAATAVLCLVVERHVGRRAARWSGAFVAGAFLSSRYAIEARSYALVALMVALAWYTLDRQLSGDAAARHRRTYVGCVILLPFAHGLSGLQVIAMVAAILWARPPRRRRAALLAPCFISLGANLALWAAGGRRVGNWVGPITSASFRHFLRRLEAPYLVLSIELLVLSIVGAWLLSRGDRRTPIERFRQVALMLWGLGAVVFLIALSVLRPSLLDRYAVASSFGLAGLLAVATTKSTSTFVRAIAPIVVLAMLFTGQGELTSPMHGWSYATKVVSDNMQPGDRIIFRPVEARLPFESSLLESRTQASPELGERGGKLKTFDRFTAADDGSGVDSLVIGRGERLWIVTDPNLAPAPGGGDADSLSTTLAVERTWTRDGVTIELLVPGR